VCWGNLAVGKLVNAKALSRLSHVELCAYHEADKWESVEVKRPSFFGAPST
jgi:hypothetical protein